MNLEALALKRAEEQMQRPARDLFGPKRHVNPEMLAEIPCPRGHRAWALKRNGKYETRYCRACHAEREKARRSKA